MNTTYKRRIPSPFQVMQNRAFDVQDKKHPVREEVKKSVGTYNLTAIFEEDAQTLALFKHVPGLIAFICTLKRDNEIIGQGRGTAVLSKVNRFIERTTRIAFNASLIDAVVRSTKALDVLQTDLSDKKEDTIPVKSVYQTSDVPASDKQKSYLLQLIETNVTNENERNEWEGKIDNLTKDEASEAIQTFKK